MIDAVMRRSHRPQSRTPRRAYARGRRCGLLGGAAAPAGQDLLDFLEIYDQHALTAQTSFYLGETTAQDGTRAARRSPYLHFTLAPT
jgi:TolA-binding protein